MEPNFEGLPTKAQLRRASILAGIGAAVIAVTAYLHAEYGSDPTRIGRVADLTEMGEIKVQLAAEAKMDRLLDEQRQPSSPLRARRQASWTVSWVCWSARPMRKRRRTFGRPA